MIPIEYFTGGQAPTNSLQSQTFPIIWMMLGRLHPTLIWTPPINRLVEDGGPFMSGLWGEIVTFAHWPWPLITRKGHPKPFRARRYEGVMNQLLDGKGVLNPHWLWGLPWRVILGFHDFPFLGLEKRILHILSIWNFIFPIIQWPSHGGVTHVWLHPSHIKLAIYIYIYLSVFSTSSTAQGGGGSFKK